MVPEPGVTDSRRVLTFGSLDYIWFTGGRQQRPPTLLLAPRIQRPDSGDIVRAGKLLQGGIRDEIVKPQNRFHVPEGLYLAKISPGKCRVGP
jgi:hypothetical protein